jgi:hypothetical protein
LPTLLIVVYVIGAVVPSTRSLHLFDKSKNYLVRLLQLCRVLPRKFRDEPPQDAAINHLFCQKAEARFSVPNQKIEQTERETALFLLASAAVLSESSSLQQGDIERHFVLMHFNSKLCALFFVCFVVSFFSSAWALLARVSSIPWPGAKPQTLFLLAALFYLLARVSGTKARQNHEHWKNLIVRSFVVMDVSGQPSHEAAKA